MFRSSWLTDLFAAGFARIPDIPIYEWAEKAFLLRKSPEPTYRSGRTPWARRIQELVRKPWHNGRRIRRYGCRKSSQSGLSEALLNAIRWLARHRPRNVIFSVDSQKEAINLRERLVPTLEDLGQQIFTGNDDDLSRYTLRLRGMDIWFVGSFSPGGYSNKFAPLVINDEVDLYGTISEEGDTIENFWSRAKTIEDGFQAVFSKPAMKGGPIDSFHARGNQERWMLPCPHCGERQDLEFERLIFGHCKDLVGVWDMERLLTETYYVCKKCGGHILDSHKPWMNERASWEGTAKGDPEIVTQHISDLPSMYGGSTFGHLAKEFVTATSTGDRKLLQSFWQQRLGLAWEERVQSVEQADVYKLRKPYRRGTIPEAGCILVLGMDIGLYVNTKWTVYAVDKHGAMWLVDWGTGDGPAAALTLLRTKRYGCARTGAAQVINFGFLDARYRRDEVYETCLMVPRMFFPCMGLKTDVASRSISYHQIPQKPIGFGVLTFIDKDAKFDLYIDCIKDGKNPPLFWPEDIDDVLVREHCAERLIRHKKTNKVVWEEEHSRPNHFGDATKIARTGVDWLIGGRRSRMIAGMDDVSASKPSPAPEAPEAGLPRELESVA